RGSWTGEVCERQKQPEILRLRLPQRARQTPLRMTISLGANLRLRTLASGFDLAYSLLATGYWLLAIPCFLLQNHGRLRLVTARGERNGRGQDERSAQPRVGAEAFAQKFHAQHRTEHRLNVQKDPGARGRHMMNAPVP